MKYYFLLVFVWLPGNAQIDLERDTLHLKEAVITNAKFTGRTKSIRYTAICSYIEFLRYYEEFITLVDRLPPGKLRDVYFKFNFWTHDDKYIQYNYQDTEIELLFYNVAENNLPGSRIEHQPIIVTIPGEHRGRMKIDLQKYNIISSGKIFVGIKRLTKNEGTAQEFEVEGICDDPKGRYTSYYRKEPLYNWIRSTNNKALKLELKVSVIK